MTDSADDAKKTPFSEATAIYIRPTEESVDAAAATFDAKTVVMPAKGSAPRLSKAQLESAAPPPTPAPSPAPSIEPKVVAATLPAQGVSASVSHSAPSPKFSVTVLEQLQKIQEKTRLAYKQAPNLMLGLGLAAIFGLGLIANSALKRSPDLDSSKSSAEIPKVEAPVELASETTAPLHRSALAVQSTADVLEEFDRAAAKTQTQASEFSRSGSGF